jgi:hypothetical protein
MGDKQNFAGVVLLGLRGIYSFLYVKHACFTRVFYTSASPHRFETERAQNLLHIVYLFRTESP